MTRLDTIDTAIVSGRAIEFDYHRIKGGRCHRRVEPLELTQTITGQHVLLASDQERPRSFRVDRITHIRMEG